MEAGFRERDNKGMFQLLKISFIVSWRMSSLKLVVYKSKEMKVIPKDFIWIPFFDRNVYGYMKFALIERKVSMILCNSG